MSELLKAEKFLRYKLFSGQHETLSEVKMAHEADISRTPIREAMVPLKSSGILEGRQGAESIINIEYKEASDLCDLRRVCEGHVIRNYIGEYSRRTGKLHDLLVDIEGTVGHADKATHLVGLNEFHTSLAGITSGPIISGAMRNIMDGIYAIVSRGTWTHNDFSENFRIHSQLLTSIETQNPTGALIALDESIRFDRKKLLQSKP